MRRQIMIAALLLCTASECDEDPPYCPDPIEVDCNGGADADRNRVPGCPFDLVCLPGTLPEHGRVDFEAGDSTVSFSWDERQE
jgi:hypothetical protein